MRHSRWLIPGVISAVIVLICVLVVPHGFIHLFGIDTQQSDNYDFWSGVGPVLVTAIGLSTLIAGAWHHLNCHTDSCLRIGRFPVAGGSFKVCSKCNRAITGRPGKLTIEVLSAEHRLHPRHQDTDSP